MSEQHPPHPDNVPGPFYIVDGCCTACDVPVSTAPELFAYDSTNHCFVQRQPASSDELNRMFRAVWGAELQCIRYRGDDPTILRRFAELGEQQLCDAPAPAIPPVVRDLVTFDTDSDDQASLTALDLAESFLAFLRDRDARMSQTFPESRYRYRFGTVTGDPALANLTFSWMDGPSHLVEFQVIDEEERSWQVRHLSAPHPSARAVSLLISDWLQGTGPFCRFRWRAADGPTASDCWSDSPL